LEVLFKKKAAKMIFLLSKTKLIRGKKIPPKKLLDFFAQTVTAAQDNHAIFLTPP